jgi:hypothetical protein
MELAVPLAKPARLYPALLSYLLAFFAILSSIAFSFFITSLHSRPTFSSLRPSVILFTTTIINFLRSSLRYSQFNSCNSINIANIFCALDNN